MNAAAKAFMRASLEEPKVKAAGRWLASKSANGLNMAATTQSRAASASNGIQMQSRRHGIPDDPSHRYDVPRFVS
jgi:hypothetical protein